MPNTHPSKLSFRLVISVLVLCVCAAGLATAVAAPTAATAHAAIAQPSEWQIDESEWDIFDNPALLPDRNSWWGGKLTNERNQHGQPYGHGPARHNGSSYAWVSEETGNPADHWARWDMGTREGTQDLAVFIPRADASARVRYRVIIGSRTTYTSRITQQEIYGWHSLGTVAANGSRVRIEVHYNDSQPAPGLTGPSARRVGVDAMAMRCVSDCQPETTRTDEPGAPRNVRLQVVIESNGSRTVVATWSPPADDGGSAITNYRVSISRPGREFGPWNRRPNARSLRFGNAWSNTTYTVHIRAENAVGIGIAASSSITTPGVSRADVPGAPRNVRLQVVIESNGSRTAVATWSPPADDGGSAITNYRVSISRPGREFGPWNRRPNARSLRFGNAWSNTTYTVHIRAENAVGVGPAIERSITTTTSPPSSPRDARVITSDGAFEVTWTPPAQSGSSPLSHYRIRYCRPSCSGDVVWSDADDVPATGESHVSHVNMRVGAGRTYHIELWAVNNDDRRSPIVELYAPAIATPEVTVEPEGRSWIIDDPDALVLWDSVDSARAYEIDWRYMRIETDRLRDIYYQLQDENISDSAKERLSREAAALLDGTEISVSQLGGDSRPASGGGREVFCRITNDLESRLCNNSVTGRVDRFDPDDPSYRIHSDQQDKVLQVRVRAIGSVSAKGSWSEWAYHPSSRFNAGCTFLDTYNTIKNIQTAIDTASVILTVGGVVASIFTAGTSVVASQGIRQALIIAAKEIVKLIVKNIAIRRFMVSLIRDLAKRVVEKSALELAGFAFGCLTHGADLQKGDAKALGEQLIQELRDSAIESLDWERALTNWKLVDIK